MFPAANISATGVLGFLAGIGTTELLIIAAVAFIVLGPAKLPEFMRTVRKSIRELRKASDDFRDGLYGSVEDVRDTLDDTRNAIVGTSKRSNRSSPALSPAAPPPGSPAALPSSPGFAPDAASGAASPGAPPAEPAATDPPDGPPQASTAPAPSAPEPSAPEPGSNTLTPVRAGLPDADGIPSIERVPTRRVDLGPEDPS